jgi:hypothetical protein
MGLSKRSSLFDLNIHDEEVVQLSKKLSLAGGKNEGFPSGVIRSVHFLSPVYTHKDNHRPGVNLIKLFLSVSYKLS